ncbi:GNAT family N-acetyltransferase [Halorussus salinus]|uniref:GNAT family N-acetyltransferase n=1 Tax=Halorussus salinus TaxID=1364935 RepID=UPI001092BD25|nr:GNAT family N-acetyltransferase [Halorussus salinus]
MSADATDAELDAANAEANATDAGSDATGDEVGGDEFPAPPRTFTDGEERVLRLLASEASAASDNESPSDSPSSDHHEELAAMYDAFESGDRAQGIPPANPRRRGEWLDRLREGIEVVACHDERAVGHGILLDGGPGHELALFVHPDYRGAGIGTALVRALLGEGRSAGVERVWLSVERTNRPAVSLYRGAGFEPTDSGLGELEMARSLR